MSATSQKSARASGAAAVPLAVSCGDPCGVGPVVAVRAALAVARGRERLRLFGDGAQLERLLHEAPAEVRARVAIESVSALDARALRHHAPSRDGGTAALAALEAAAAAVRSGACRALVTAPLSKSAIAQTGRQFVGQTEHLAEGAGLPADGVTMMFLGPRLKVALVTTHLAIRDLPAAITRRRVMRTIAHLGEALSALGTRPGGRVLVTGLNPHAGEDGLFGDEEPNVVAPAVSWGHTIGPYLRKALVLEGPIGAETAFREAKTGAAAGVVAMFHDQATIASKLLDWGAASNVTWGLGYIRTSVDHGVAWDAAKSGRIDAAGMIAATKLARRLSRGKTAPSRPSR